MSHHPTWVTPKGSIGAYPSLIPLSFTFSATPDDVTDTLSYTVLSGSLPKGLTLNSTTGILSGTPGSVGVDTVYNFAVRASEVNNTTEIADLILMTVFGENCK